MTVKLKINGVKITDKGFKRITKELKELKNTRTLVGLPGDLGNHGDENISIAEIGAQNEFGHSNVPSRPWMRQTADRARTKRKFTSLMKSQYSKMLTGMTTPRRINRFLGEWYISELKQTIKNGNFVPNSEFTTLNKGSTTPLIDTGLMRNSITSRIEYKGSRARR